MALADQAAASALRLWPNPAHGVARLSGLTIGAVSVQLLDALGQQVRLTVSAPDGTAVLDLRGLTPGFYVVRAGRSARRLVVE